MAYTVCRSCCFEEDYDNILAYILQVLKAPHAALSLMDEVDRMLDLLEAAPYTYGVARAASSGMPECRERLVKGYRIVYKVRDVKVYLLRMFHQVQQREGVVIDWD